MRSAVLGLIFAVALLSAQAATVRIAAGELPPYATESRPDQGVALQIVRRAFELAGHEVRYHFLPWTRAQHETLAGLWDASAYWGASEQRRRDFLLSDTILTEQWVMVHRRDVALDWRKLADLKPWRLGVIRDYTYTTEFWALLKNGTLHGDYTPNDVLGLRKLLADRIDVIPMERNVACDLLATHFSPEEADRLVAHPRLMTHEFTTHLLLPPRKPESRQLLDDFNRGLARLKASKEYEQILATVRCPRSWGLPKHP